MADNSPTPLTSLLAQARAAYAAADSAQAEALYRGVLALDARHVEALGMVGMLAAHAGRLEEGLSYVDKALRQDSTLGRIHFYRATILQHLQRNAEALASYGQAISREPSYAPAHLGQGMAQASMGQHEAAIASFNKAIELHPYYAEAYYNRGNALHHLQRYEDAIRNYERSIQIQPECAPFYNNLGLTLKHIGRLPEALVCYQRALASNPHYFPPHNNIGVILHAGGDYTGALQHYDTLLSAMPDFAEGHNNRGITLTRLNRYAEALSAYNEALRLHPAFADAYVNKGETLQRMNRLEEAMQCYEQASALAPDNPLAAWNQSLLLLLQGDYQRGWKGFEARWKLPDAQQPFRHPNASLWLGDRSLKGKSILLYAEQGIGDTLQFCRYAPLLVEQGAKVILVVQPELKRLMYSLPGMHHIASTGEAVPHFDYYCPLMSLPLALGTTLDTIPQHVPYLQVDSYRQYHWQHLLEKKRAPRIGIAWSGNPHHSNNHNRSIPLSQWGPIAQQNAEFHALQKDFSEEERALLLEHNITAHDHELLNFADTAALIMTMDLVISVDTACAHLAGALGVPLWVLLPFAPDYRWLMERTDSPWYPTAKLLRQTETGNWKPVITQVANTLYAQMPQPVTADTAPHPIPLLPEAER